MSLETISIKELAKLLHRSPLTVAAEVTRAPHKLPPRLNLPGSRKVLFLKSDVEAWLHEHRQKRQLDFDQA